MAQVEITGQVAAQALGTGNTGAAFRQENSGAMVVQELHGRFYESNYRGQMFQAGMGLTAINSVLFTSATLDATTTPVLGVWNPLASNVNLVIAQAFLGVTMTALQATGCGPFVWATSFNNAGISTGAQPVNLKTLQRAGSQARDMTNVALSGLTNNLLVRRGSALNGGSAAQVAFLATQVAMQTTAMASPVETFDGSLIVPPGGILALLATGTPVAHSAVSGLVWEEVPL